MSAPFLERLAARFGYVPRASVELRSERPRYTQAAVGVVDWLGGVPDPDEVLQRTGRTRADLRELLRDAEVTQVIDTRQEAVLATPWRLEAGSAGKRPTNRLHAEIAPHVQSLVSASWEALLYGYDVAEVVYTPRSENGFRFGLEKFVDLPFEWFRPMPDGTLRYFPEDGTGGPSGLLCEPSKFLLTQRKAEYRNPYGRALLSTLYWPVTWRLQGWQLWLDFLETFGAPIIVGQTPSFDGFVQAMKGQGIKRAAAWQPTSSNERMDVITVSQPGEFERLEDALNRVIWRSVLGQTLTTDVGKNGGGSHALGKVHNEVREDKRRADIRMVSETAQRFIGMYWELNGLGSAGTAPVFVMQDDVGLETERAERDGKLYALGWRPTPVYIEESYGFKPDEYTLAAEEPEDPAEEPSKAQATAALGASRFTPSQDVVERNVAQMLERIPDPVSRDDIRSAILGATDAQDLRARLATLIDARNPRFAEMLEKATYAANVLGYVHAEEETVPRSKE